MSRSLSELDKYVNTLLPNEISRLEVHTEKLSRYLTEGEKRLFQEEEREAKSSLKNLKSNLKILGNITNGLSHRDQREAERIISPLRHRIQVAVHNFQEVCPGPTLLHVDSLTASASQTDLLIEPETIGDSKWQRITMAPLEGEGLTPEQASAYESAGALQKDLEEIQLLFSELRDLAANQNIPISRLEEKTEQTAQNISESRDKLSYANKLKAAGFPVMCGIIGGMIGGPIGAVGGLKGAAILGMGGVSIGAATGWGIKKFHNWSTERLHEKEE